LKRGGGGGVREVPLDESVVEGAGEAADGLRRAVEVDAALRKLERVEPRWAAVAEMRLFGNLPTTMIAERLGVTARTVERDWERASAWLRERMGE
jgi:DNA-directed RNA polymerase specialized sigma24 family protein